jgi:hypothetical protein
MDFVYYECDLLGDITNSIGVVTSVTATNYDELSNYFYRLGIYVVTIYYKDSTGITQTKDVKFKIVSPLEPDLLVFTERGVVLTPLTVEGKEIPRYLNYGNARIPIQFEIATEYIEDYENSPSFDEFPDGLVLSNFKVEKFNEQTKEWELYLKEGQAIHFEEVKENNYEFDEPGRYRISYDFWNGDGKECLEKELIVLDETQTNVEWGVYGARLKGNVPNISDWGPLFDQLNQTIFEFVPSFNWDANEDSIQLDNTTRNQYYKLATVWGYDPEILIDEEFTRIEVAHFTLDNTTWVFDDYYDIFNESKGPNTNYENSFTKVGLYVVRVVKKDIIGNLVIEYKTFEIVEDTLPDITVVPGDSTSYGRLNSDRKVHRLRAES